MNTLFDCLFAHAKTFAVLQVTPDNWFLQGSNVFRLHSIEGIQACQDGLQSKVLLLLH